MRPDLAISIFTRNALENKPLEIFGDGSFTRDFTYVDDVVDLNMKCLRSNNANGETFNVGSGERITILELAKKIIKINKSNSKITFSNRKKGDMEHTLADVSKAKKLLGYDPKHKLDEGLRMFSEWMKNV